MSTARGVVFLGLFFLPHALERFCIGFLIHKAAIIEVSLHEPMVDGIIDLGSIANGTVPMSVAFWWICGHFFRKVEAARGTTPRAASFGQAY